MIRKSVLPSTVENLGGNLVTTAARLPVSPHRYTYAKNDPAHCTVPGLFQPLKRGVRKGRNHTVTHQYGDVILEFSCFEPLGADDLRVLQGLLAIGSPISEPVVLTADTSNEVHREIRRNLNLTESCLHLETLVVQGSCYQLAKEIGLCTEGSATFRRIRASLRRLCRVTIIARYKDGREHGYQLIGGYSSDEGKKEIEVVLNPRLTAAVLGKRIDASGGYTRIEMDEVRRIKGDATRILHTYLCAIISPGETRELLASTMRVHTWLQKPEPKQNKEARTKWLERVKKQHQRIRQAMIELNGIGWRCTQITDNRPNSKQPHYIKWEVCRPAILEAEENPTAPYSLINPAGEREFSTCTLPSTVPLEVENSGMENSGMENRSDLSTIVKLSPARAIKEFGILLTDEQFSIAAGKQPVAAIKHAIDRLSDEQFAVAVSKVPEAALRYALQRVSDDQLMSATKSAPSAAIQYALARLNPDQFVTAAKATRWPVGNPMVSDSQLDAWFSSDPETAADHLETIIGKKLPTFPDLIPHLSAERMKSCAHAWPEVAFKIAKSIPPSLLCEIARDNPGLAIEHACHVIPQETMDECILAAPYAAICHRFVYLDSDQRKWCLKKSPWTAIARHYKELSQEERDSCLAAIDKALPAKLDQIIREAPSIALNHGKKYLTQQQFRICMGC